MTKPSPGLFANILWTMGKCGWTPTWRSVSGGEAGVHGIRQLAVDKGGSSANREYIIFHQSGHTLPLCQNLWVLIPIDGGKCITQVDCVLRASLHYRRGSDGLSSRMMEALDGRSSLLFQLLRYAAGWGLLGVSGGSLA